MFKDKYEFVEELQEAAQTVLGKEFSACSAADKYYVLAKLIATEAGEFKIACA